MISASYLCIQRINHCDHSIHTIQNLRIRNSKLGFLAHSNLVSSVPQHQDPEIMRACLFIIYNDKQLNMYKSHKTKAQQPFIHGYVSTTTLHKRSQFVFLFTVGGIGTNTPDSYSVKILQGWKIRIIISCIQYTTYTHIYTLLYYGFKPTHDFSIVLCSQVPSCSYLIHDRTSIQQQFNFHN